MSNRFTGSTTRVEGVDGDGVLVQHSWFDQRDDIRCGRASESRRRRGSRAYEPVMAAYLRSDKVEVVRDERSGRGRARLAALQVGAAADQTGRSRRGKRGERRRRGAARGEVLMGFHEAESSETCPVNHRPPKFLRE